jgi:hypothetical protein
MIQIELRADCARCAALCCVALAFDKSDLFAFDKVSGEPCRNLRSDAGCQVYARRVEDGLRGCLSYDCLGVGQRVTQEFFDGRSWLEDRSLLTPMMEAFFRLGRVHELLALLCEAEKLRLAPHHKTRLDRLQSLLAGTALSQVEIRHLEVDVHEFIQRLRIYIGGRPAARGVDQVVDT